MNIQQLRQSLKEKWISYYYKNRSWLVRMKIWATYNGQRRPSSGFILATLSALEPQLEQLFPFILELNSDPDHIVAALGLNFNPEEQLHLVKDSFVAENPQSSQSNLDKPVSNKPLSDSGHVGDRQTPYSQQQGNHKVSAANTDPTRVQLESLSTTSSTPVREEHGQSIEKSNSGYKPVVAITVATEAQNKSKSVKSIALTKVENSTVIPITKAIRMNGKSQPLTSVAIATKTEDRPTPVFPIAVGTKVVSSAIPIAMATKMENPNTLVISNTAVELEGKHKLANMEDRDIPNHEAHPPSVNKVCKLANWIDDFCQGSGWDRDEAFFIPF